MNVHFWLVVCVFSCYIFHCGKLSLRQRMIETPQENRMDTLHFPLFLTIFLCGSILVGVNGHSSPCNAPASVTTSAVAILTGDKSDGVVGTVRFTQPDGLSGPTLVRGVIYNLTEGEHGLNVHERGYVADGCDATGDHYNPDGYEHSALRAPKRHAGDLGNIYADEYGTATVDRLVSSFTLNGAYSVIGRSLVVHEKQDDHGQGGQSDSRTTGHSGTGVACGVIGIEHEISGGN